jgi:predicted enzyme related to lactoylglutathione lyase
MKPITIRYVQDVDTTRRFYEALGLKVDFESRPTREGTSVWQELAGNGGTLALHHVPPQAQEPPVSLAFMAGEPLETVAQRLRAAGYELATGIVDESFGRSFTIKDPEGLRIQINEHDRELHGAP